jgi:inner membrane protein involved in colicin E2 resistance
MAPVAKEHTASGWRLTWKYDKLLTDVKIGLAMPEKLNPGPWATKVTAAAPVSLFLYFFLLFVLTTVKKIKIHPMNFFFIGAAFFSFHLLLAYLVDHISIHLAFWICSAVSVFLVISYMRLVVGLKIAFVEISLSQLVYLVFFSYTFFFKGYTGLTITILCICTLFIVMQFTGRVDWEKLFEKPAMPQNQETKS